MYYCNENLIDLYRTTYTESRDKYLRMDLNENPGGFSKEFIQKVLSTVTPEFISMYPEQDEFTRKLGEFIGAEENQICLTNGSAEAIRFIIEAYTRPNGKILSVTPSYAMYEVFANMYGREHITAKYNDDLSFSIERLIEQITPDVDLVVVLNPNNPVGDAYTDEEMQQILEAAKKNEATVLIDEAYHYFYPHTFIKYALNNDHVFVVRTFSKLFSLAGCRLGYAVGKAEGVSLLRKLCTPHNINGFSIKFAQAIIEEPGMVEDLIAKQLDGKEFLVSELRNRGYEVSAKEGNFIFISTKSDPDILVERMKEEKGILIKTYSGIGSLGKCLRVSTAERKFMKIFLDAMDELDK